jgi:DNA invertase Pin-like site-specific DNA recombinase
MMAIYCRTSKESETSIEQQKKIGIHFALKNKLEYEVYEDEGISGFKISDDDLDPFNNRPSFTTMINDIKQKKITKVWVFEHSRLSRNQYASAAIFNIFEKYQIELFENDKKLELNDPQFQMMRQILDAISQYERHLIVNRTTRGLHNAMDSGARGYSCFFGYEKIGFNEMTNGKKRKMQWRPIDSQLNIINYAYDRILNGISYGVIARELFDKKLISNIKTMHRTRFLLSRYLSHFEYTGHTFNHEGKVIWRKIMSGEKIDIHILNNPKYYTTSKSYPEKLISIDDWFKVFERLIAVRTVDSEKKKTGKKRASSSLATGIIKCSDCGMMFYTRRARNAQKKTYDYYKHISAETIGDRCKQKPKTFRMDNTDEIFKTFFFFNSTVFDNSIALINETLFSIKQEISIADEKIDSITETIVKNEKQLNKFNKAHDEADDIETMKFYVKRITEIEAKNELLTKEKTSLIIKREELSIKYSGTELEKVYYNVKDLVLQFFNEQGNEEKRNHLIRVMKSCYAFGDFILIDTGSIVYLFDTKIKIKFNMSLLENLDEDIIYKNYFVNEQKQNNEIKKSDKEKNIYIPLPALSKLVDEDHTFLEFDLDNPQGQYEANDFMTSNNIVYDISKHYKLILSV